MRPRAPDPSSPRGRATPPSRPPGPRGQGAQPPPTAGGDDGGACAQARERDRVGPDEPVRPGPGPGRLRRAARGGRRALRWGRRREAGTSRVPARPLQGGRWPGRPGSARAPVRAGRRRSPVGRDCGQRLRAGVAHPCAGPDAQHAHRPGRPPGRHPAACGAVAGAGRRATTSAACEVQGPPRPGDRVRTAVTAPAGRKAARRPARPARSAGQKAQKGLSAPDLSAGPDDGAAGRSQGRRRGAGRRSRLESRGRGLTELGTDGGRAGTRGQGCVA